MINSLGRKPIKNGSRKQKVGSHIQPDVEADLPRSPCFLSSTISLYPNLKHDLPSLLNTKIRSDFVLIFNVRF